MSISIDPENTLNEIKRTYLLIGVASVSINPPAEAR